MYLHFEDWSQPVHVEKLERAELPHAGKIIKVYASPEDPSQLTNGSELVVVEVDDSKFSADETYSYPDRGDYDGPGLEQQLREYELATLGRSSLRSLFRFAEQHGFSQAAMAARQGDDWLIKHPFDQVDGIEEARFRTRRAASLHLDIFFPESVEHLRSIVDLDRPETMLDHTLGRRWREELVSLYPGYRRRF